MLLEITKEKLISSLAESKGKTLLIASPNYEQRSLALPNLIRDSISSKQISAESIVLRFITLQSNSQAVGILDELKRLNIDRAREVMEGLDCKWNTISYPDAYNQGTVSDLLREWIQRLDGDSTNIVVDISALPRSVIIDLSKAVDELLQVQRKKVESIFVVYTSAESYPSQRYPQDIGSLKTHFAKRPLQEIIRESRFPRIEATIFPGIQGFEAKLMIDELHDNVTEVSEHILVFVSGRDFITSMIIMRANQQALQQAKTIEYFFSYPDGVKKLKESVSSRLQMASPKTMFLIAPFGPKPFAWVAYPVCKQIKGAGDYEAEIVLLSGFQYTSVYSLGIGNISVFKLLAQA